MTTLDVTQLVSGYRASTVLKSVSFSLRSGEIVAIVGSNGAGKSTLLRTISGVVKTRSGSISLDGKPLTGRAPENVSRAGVAHVPEGRGIFTSLTVAENLLLGRAGHASDASRAKPAFGMPDAFDLFPVIGRRRSEWAGNLSGGEQQMLAIARALMAGPHILMIDEPSLGLAPLIVDEVYRTLSRLREDQSIGILVIEQSMDRAASLADRTMLMSEGTLLPIQASGGQADIKELARTYFGMTHTEGAA